MNVFKSALYVLAANALVLLASFLFRPLTARFLGPTEYGLFALILSTAAVIPAFTLFSFNSAVLYFASKNPSQAKKAVTNSIVLLGILSLVLYFPLQLFVLFLAPTLTFFDYTVSFFLSVGLALLSILQARLQSSERFDLYSQYNVSSSVLAGLLALAGAYYFQSGPIAGLMRAFAIFFVALAGFLFYRSLGKFDMPVFRKMLSYSLPLGLAGLVATFIVVADRYVLAAFRGTAEVGYYDIAYSLVAATLPFSGALLTAIMPKLIKNQRSLSAYYSRVAQFNTVVLSSIGLFFFYYSDIIITFLLGSEYAQASLPLKILSLSLPLMAFYGLNGAALDSSAKTKLSGFLAALLTVFSVTFNLLLVPFFGAAGASLANLFNYAVIVTIGLYYLVSRRQVEFGQSSRQFSLFLAFGILFFLLFEKGGFTNKTLAFAAFLALTYALNKTMASEIIARAKTFFKTR